MEISLKSNSSITFKKSILVLNELKGNVVLQFMSEPPHPHPQTRPHTTTIEGDEDQVIFIIVHINT